MVSSKSPITTQKSTFEEEEIYAPKLYSISYFLLIIGGVFGLHHFYLRRHVQGLIYATTFGLCGVGVWRDLFRLPTYIEQANQTKKEFLEYNERNGSTWYFSHILAQWALCHYYIILLLLILKIFGFENYVIVDASTMYVCRLIAYTLGCWIVQSTGRTECSFLYVFLGSCAAVLYVWYQEGSDSGGGELWIPIIISQYTTRCRMDPKPIISGTQVCIMFLISSCLFSSGLYQLVKYLEDKEDFNFHFDSAEFSEFFDSGSFHPGKTFEYISDRINDPGSLTRSQAYSVLGLDRSATDKEIKKAYRTLTVKYHPDHLQAATPEEVEQAEKNQMLLNRAKELLLKKQKSSFRRHSSAKPEKKHRKKYRSGKSDL